MLEFVKIMQSDHVERTIVNLFIELWMLPGWFTFYLI